MGNDLCISHRKCESNNHEMFGILCKRPYDKPVVVKFEKQNTYLKKKRKKIRKKNRYRTTHRTTQIRTN